MTHTLVFLVFLTSLFHLLVQTLNYNKDSKRVAYFNRVALNAAATGQGKREKIDSEESARRVRVPMVEGSDMGGYLELVVIGEHVYLVSLRPFDNTLDHTSNHFGEVAGRGASCTPTCRSP